MQGVGGESPQQRQGVSPRYLPPTWEYPSCRHREHYLVILVIILVVVLAGPGSPASPCSCADGASGWRAPSLARSRHHDLHYQVYRGAVQCRHPWSIPFVISHILDEPFPIYCVC